MITEQELVKIKSTHFKAVNTVLGLAAGTQKFTMSIPVNRDRDTDCILMDGLDLVNSLIERVLNLEQALVNQDAVMERLGLLDVNQLEHEVRRLERWSSTMERAADLWAKECERLSTEIKSVTAPAGEKS